jgi:hypothetical protein
MYCIIPSEADEINDKWGNLQNELTQTGSFIS